MSNAKREKQSQKQLQLPQSRVRTIMKSSFGTGPITSEVSFLMTKCTELFVQHLARKAYLQASFPEHSSATLTYKHISQLVNKSNNLVFLQLIVPKKIRVHEFMETLQPSRLSPHETSFNSVLDDEEIINH